MTGFDTKNTERYPNASNHGSYPRATTAARTDEAPAPRQALAQASRVAPVVEMSSTSSTSFLWKSPDPAPKAFLTFAARSLMFRPTYDSVSRTRLSVLGSY